MSNEQLAAALRKIAEGLYEAADVLFGVPEPTTTAGAVLTRPSAVPEPSDELFPPFAPTEYEALPFTPAQVDSSTLSRCPAHDRAWTVKAAGVSKAGKAYQSFYKCDGKDADGSFCPRKPVKAWADSHPIREGVPA